MVATRRRFSFHPRCDSYRPAAPPAPGLSRRPQIIVYVGSSFTDSTLKVDFVSIVLALFLIAIPVSIGIAIRRYNTKMKFKGILISSWIEKIGSAIGAIFLVIVLVFGILDNQHLFSARWQLWLGAALLQPAGCLFGYLMMLACRFHIRDARTVFIGFGVSSPTVVISIITLSFADEVARREVLSYPLLFSVFYVIYSLPGPFLLRCWALRDPEHFKNYVDMGDGMGEPGTAGGNANKVAVSG